MTPGQRPKAHSGKCFYFLLLIFMLTASCGPLAAAQQCHKDAVVDRPTIGLALGGGGARGGAHIGVIRALEELNVPVDYIAGTSMGSIVGGMMAVGMTPNEMEETITGIDWNELFEDDTEREDLPYQRKRDDDLGLFGPKLGIGEDSTLLPQGFIAGQKILVLFESVTTARVQPRNFDELPIPFRAIAADISTGDPVVINHSDLALAMRASMSVPAVFNPVPYGDHLLVDGGIANNLPVDVVRDMGADIVIAINVGSPLLETDKLTNALAITSQLSTIMVQKNTQRQIATLTASDVLISGQAIFQRRELRQKSVMPQHRRYVRNWQPWVSYRLTTRLTGNRLIPVSKGRPSSSLFGSKTAPVSLTS
jgi:NTE family protein